MEKTMSKTCTCDPGPEGQHQWYCGLSPEDAKEDWGMATSEPVPERSLFPRFPADAVLVVDAHNGDEQWTGEEWNAYADRCEANRSEFIVRLIKVLDSGGDTTGCRPVCHYGTDDGAGSLHQGARADCTHPDCHERASR